MVNRINEQTASILMRGQIPVQEPSQVKEAAPERRQDMSQYREEKYDLNDPNQAAAAQQDTREQVKREPIRAEGKLDVTKLVLAVVEKIQNCHGRRG